MRCISTRILAAYRVGDLAHIAIHARDASPAEIMRGGMIVAHDGERVQASAVVGDTVVHLDGRIVMRHGPAEEGHQPEAG